MATWNKKRPAVTPAAPAPEQAAPATKPEPATEVVATTTVQTDAPAETPATDRVASRVVAIKTQLVDARALKEKLLIELGSGLDREQQLVSVDGEIAQLERQLVTFAEAQRLAAARNSKEAKVERAVQLRAEAQAAVDSARELLKEQAEIVEAMARINARIAEVRKRQAFVGFTFGELVQEAGAKNAQRLIEKHDQVRRVVSQLVPLEPIRVPGLPDQQQVIDQFLKLARENLLAIYTRDNVPLPQKAA